MPEKSNIAAELEALQLEEAREAAADRQRRRVSKATRIRAIQDSLKQDNKNQARIQAICQHRKGGKGLAQMYMGNDANYAVVTHHLSYGPTIVLCQRCGKLWRPPEQLPKKATPEQKAKFREDLAEYRRALNFPTDNEPSGSVLFAFSTPEEESAA
jgi:hypothetical protein